MAAMHAFSWAHGRLGAGSATVALLLALGSALLAGSLLRERPTRAAALLPAAAVAGLWLLSMTGRAVAPSWHEPLYSPIASPQSGTIRSIVLQLGDEGPVVVHPELERLAVWPLRDVGSIVVASRPQPGDAVLIWPADAPPPDGFVPLEGRWTLAWSTELPGGVRPFLRWLSDRNSLPRDGTEVRIFTRAAE